MSDASNASRTSLLPLLGRSWDDELCDLFGVPRAALPEVVDSAGAFGATWPSCSARAIPITGLAGDQQAATIGQGCLAPGDTKATYGTGAFVLTNHRRGERRIRANRLLGTVLCQIGGSGTYALEGSVFVAGSLIQWLRDCLGVIDQRRRDRRARPLGARQRRSGDRAGAVRASARRTGGPMRAASITGLELRHRQGRRSPAPRSRRWRTRPRTSPQPLPPMARGGARSRSTAA